MKTKVSWHITTESKPWFFYGLNRNRKDIPIPYPGVPAELTGKMEDCVKQVMDDGHDKSSAIAICHSRIMGKKTTMNENINKNKKGGDKRIMAKTTKVIIEETDNKVEDVIVEKGKKTNPVVEEPKQEPKVEEAPVETPVVETPAETPVEPEVKPEETPAPVEEPKAEVVEEPKTEEPAVVEAPVAPEAPVETPVVQEADKTGDLSKIESILTKVVDRLEKLEEKLVKAAPAEEAAAPVETPKAVETPVVEVPVAPKEETPAVVETPAEAPKEEAKEEAKVSDTPSEGAVEKLTKVISELKERLEKMENSPAPSRVVAFSKAFAGEEALGEELTKVETRIAEIEKIRDENPTEYAHNTKLWDEALALIEKRRNLKGK